MNHQSKAFIHNDFLLLNKTARHLYHKYASRQPILDFHCHLPVKDIADDRRFNNLAEIWLEGDHYKWRAMRANAVPERYCMGDASAYDKFMAWARTVPYTLRNPLYHWTHLELKRYFDIDDLLDETTGPAIWDRTSAALQHDQLTAHGILRRFDVKAVCTSDDPTDSLEEHKKIARSGLATKVYPTFRPDKALHTANVPAFNAWVDRLAASANIEVAGLDDYLEALHQRHDHFHANRCRLSDHGLNYCYANFATEDEAHSIFAKLRAGHSVTDSEAEHFGGYMMLFFGRLDAKKGWTKQLHLGAYRNVNPAMLQSHGRDIGFDSIGDWRHAERLGAYLGHLEHEGSLPKMILYNVNPSDNYVFATMIGNFQDGTVPGKIQFGSGWWFLDQKEAMEWQLNALSNTGLLSRFIGMATDSRSFMSYPRHEYFRRVLCNLIGTDVENGLLPDNEGLIARLITDLCFTNAADYFALPLAEVDKSKLAPLTKD